MEKWEIDVREKFSEIMEGYLKKGGKNKDLSQIESLIFKKNGTCINGINTEIKIDDGLWLIEEFINLKKLSLIEISDHIIFTACGSESFSYKYWFSTFKNLIALAIREFKDRENREAQYYRIGNFIFCQYETRDGYGIEIIAKQSEKIEKSLFFGKRKKDCDKLLILMLGYIIENSELPSNDKIELFSIESHGEENYSLDFFQLDEKA